MGSSKSDKIVAIIEVIVLLILMIAYFIKVCLPDIKKNIGSSDKIISYTNYLNMFEINIDGDVNFAFVINKDYKINHIMFFSKNTRCLYNQNIETSSSNKEAVDSAIKLLISNNLLTTTSVIKVTKYSDDYYSKFKKYFDEVLNKYGIDNSYLEDSSDLIKKSSLLGSDTESEAHALRNIVYYSKEILPELAKAMREAYTKYPNIPHDELEGAVLSKLRIRTCIPRPCLVQHIDKDTLIQKYKCGNRRTPYFIDYLEELNIPYEDACEPENKQKLIDLMNKKFNEKH